MRLTLRTLLAWLDDTLPPSQVREIGKQVAESPYTRDLIERIHRVSRQRRHTVPRSTGPEATDPNIVASYVDNELDPEQLAEYEKKCLTSDVNLAEVASVHQILSLLGQKVHVPPEAKTRMYHLVRGRESIPPPRPDGYKPPPPEPVTKPIQPWVAPVPPERHWVERFGPLAGCLALIAILCWSAYESIGPPAPESRSVEIPQPVLQPSAVPAAVPKKSAEPEKQELASAATPTPAAPAAGEPKPETIAAATPPAAPATGEPKKEVAAAPVPAPTAAPTPAPVAPAPGPVRAVPAGAVGVVDKIDGLLLRFNTEKREWVRISDGTALETSDRLVCIAPFRARLVLAKTPVTLLGETHVRILSKSVSDAPGIELGDGRAVVDASAPAGIIKVEYSGRAVSIDRPSQCAVGLERPGKWVYGQAQALPPGLAVFTSEGEVKLSLGQAKETLTGPGSVFADANARLLVRPDKKLPEWLTSPTPTEKDQKLGEQFLQQFAADRPVLADMVAATGSESPVIKKLAIFGVKALGDLSLLTPMLPSPGDPSARQSTTEALRWIISQGPQARKRLREQLDEDFGLAQGQVIEKLLIGYTPEEAAKKKTLTDLVTNLLNPSLAIRELAIDNLKTLTAQDDLGYDPDHPDEKAVGSWRSAVNKEPARPAPKRKTAD